LIRLLFTHCTKANVSDDSGLIEMLTLNIDYFTSKPVNIPKITILLDHGYHIDYLIEALEGLSSNHDENHLSFDKSPRNKRRQRKENLDLCLRWLDG